MTKTHTLLSALILLILSSIAAAQTETARTSSDSATTITASSTGERVRFTASSSVVQIRLEVYNSAGAKLFDNEVRGGNVLDWHLQDGQAEPLADDAYLCVVTVKSLSGRIGQRIGSVTVEKSSATVQPIDVSQITAQQAQAVGPVEADAALTVLGQDENRTTTILGHNGEDGQITRGRGALSFRLGDFYTGRDIEQMRLTPEGNLGIGITRPLVRLDVDGLIRASQGIMFPDGTIQTTAAIAGNVTRGTTGQPRIVPGSKTGKPGKVSGATGDAKNKVSPEFMVNEDLTVNGNIIFTPGLSRDITMQNNNGGIRIFANPTLTGSPVTAAIQFFGNGHPGFPGQAYIDAGANDNAAVIFRTAGTGGTIAERMRITATGNVGVGTNSPTAKLHVAGGEVLFENKWRTETTTVNPGPVPGPPNLIGGFLGTGGDGSPTPGNRVSPGVVGSTIGGGGFNGTIYFPSGGSVGPGDSTNRVTDWFGTVGGGFSNRSGNDNGILDDAIFATVAGGYNNIASGGGSTVGGGTDNVASGSNSTVAGGGGNNASGYNSIVGGGVINQASGAFSVVPGGLHAAATHYGEMALASGLFQLRGDAQTSVYTLRQKTTDATTTELFLDGSSSRITIASGRALSFDILVVAKTSSGTTAGHHFLGVIKNVGGTTSLVGSGIKQVLGVNDPFWDVNVEADDTNDALVIKVTGVGSTTIRWVATVRTVELQF